MKKILVTKTARKDLHEIWHYVAHDSVESANRVINAIHAEITKVAEMPGIGHPRRDLTNPNYRFGRFTPISLHIGCTGGR